MAESSPIVSWAGAETTDDGVSVLRLAFEAELVVHSQDMPLEVIKMVTALPHEQ